MEEEAWNAYPYTKTRYTCPFVEKFCIEIETMYFNDPGDSENVFKISSAEARNTVVGMSYKIATSSSIFHCFVLLLLVYSDNLFLPKNLEKN